MVAVRAGQDSDVLALLVLHLPNDALNLLLVPGDWRRHLVMGTFSTTVSGESPTDTFPMRSSSSSNSSCTTGVVKEVEDLD